VLGEGRYWLECALAADPSPTAARAAAQSALTRVLISQGRLTDAAVSSDAALALAREDPVLAANARYEAGAAILLSDGDLDRAQELLDEAEAGFAGGADPLSRTMALTTSALTALYRGDLDRADLLSTHCLQTCRERGDLWWRANILQISAAVAFARGELDRGSLHAREALRLHDQVGDSRGLSVAFDGVATATAGNDPERAAALLGIGFRLWLSIGGERSKPDMYWHGREDLRIAVRSRLGERDFDAAFERGRGMSHEAAVGYALGTSPSPEQSPGLHHAADVPLTRREQDVARLLGKGLSNRQVAARLVISPRTAESHVENILRKLGFTSRVQLAAWINEGHLELG
jgi:DNA-binding CsgD family transcriptional regulator